MMAAEVRTEVRRWWGRRWLEALDAAGPSAARAVRRGHGLVRRGAVRDLRLEAGRIAGSVLDDRGGTVHVELGWPVPDERAWDDGLAVLGSQLRFSAALLDGELPTDLADALAEVGVDLVPAIDALELACTCADRERPCRHVAAVLVAAAVQVDRAPAMLFTLRGRGRDELLDQVRQGSDGEPDTHQLDLARGLEAAHGDLEAIELRPTPVDDPAGLLRHLGPPPGVDDPRPLERLVERSAATAWRLAAGDGSEAADEELLLAELRAQRTASAEALAAALGRDVEAVRVQLDELFEVGEVLRTGTGERARYRAASS